MLLIPEFNDVCTSTKIKFDKTYRRFKPFAKTAGTNSMLNWDKQHAPLNFLYLGIQLPLPAHSKASIVY